MTTGRINQIAFVVRDCETVRAGNGKSSARAGGSRDTLALLQWDEALAIELACASALPTGLRETRAVAACRPAARHTASGTETKPEIELPYSGQSFTTTRSGPASDYG